MITSEQIASFSSAERSAWIDSLSDDELQIVYTPVGRRGEALYICFIKMAIISPGMTAGDRLRFLEWLAKMPDQYWSEEMIAVIDPACETVFAMIKETNSLPMRERFDVWGRWEFFTTIVKLNPSMLTAIKMRPFPIAP